MQKLWIYLNCYGKILKSTLKVNTILLNFRELKSLLLYISSANFTILCRFEIAIKCGKVHGCQLLSGCPVVRFVRLCGCRVCQAVRLWVIRVRVRLLKSLLLYISSAKFTILCRFKIAIKCGKVNGCSVLSGCRKIWRGNGTEKGTWKCNGRESETNVKVKRTWKWIGMWKWIGLIKEGERPNT